MKFSVDYPSFGPPIFQYDSPYYADRPISNINHASVKAEKTAQISKSQKDAFFRKIDEVVHNVKNDDIPRSLEGITGLYQKLDCIVEDEDVEVQQYYKRYGYPKEFYKEKAKKVGKFERSDFKHHITKKEALDGLKKGKFVEGVIRKLEQNEKIAFITVDGLKVDVIINSERNQNRSLDKDRVVIELFNPSNWEKMEKKVSTFKEGKISNNAPIEERTIDATKDDSPAEDENKESATEEEKKESPADEKKKDSDYDSEADESKLKEDFLKKMEERKNERQNKRYGNRSNENTGLKLPNIHCQKDLIDFANANPDFRPIGSIVHILESRAFNKQHLCKKMREMKRRPKKGKSDNTKQDKLKIVPLDKRVKLPTIETLPKEVQQSMQKEGDTPSKYYLFNLTSWKYNEERPTGEVVSTLGNAGDIAAETLRIIKQYDLFEEEFSKETMESLEVFEKDVNPETKEWKIPEEELKSRVDLREKRIFSIDPKTAKDLDDALSIDKIDDDTYEIGVHIADVSYFVQQGSALDEEASFRATSVYFVHQVIPMLPRILCENLCSLNPNVERLAYSCFFRITKDGMLVEDFKPRMCRSVIKSCTKFHYELVQDILDKKVTSMDQIDEDQRTDRFTFDEIAGDCFLLNEIAQKRRIWRFDNGSLTLENPEFFFQLDEHNMPKMFEEVEKIESKSLIEEFMLIANMKVAEYISEFCQDKAVLRNQFPPEDEKYMAFDEYCKRLNADMDLTDTLSLHKSFIKLKSNENTALYQCVMRKFFGSIE